MRRVVPAPRIAAVILAAGLSRRMGRSKPLLDLGGQTLIECVLDILHESKSVSPVIVVAGHSGGRVASLLKDRPVQIVYNANYEKGEMLSSVQAGLQALPDDADAVMIVLCDQPMISPSTVARLAQAWPARRPRVLLPTMGGRHGHPIVLSTEGVHEILNLPADATLKTYTARYAGSTIEVEVDDPEILRDLDTPEEYAQAVEDCTTRRSRSCPTEA